MKPRSHQRPAVVLVMALLLMGAIIGSAIALSTVIADSNHQTTSLNNFISASIGADSGLERALAVIKQGRVSSTLDATRSAAGLATTTPNIGTTQTNVAVTESASGDTFYVPKLLPGQSVSVDILNTQTVLNSVTPGVTPDTLTVGFEASSFSSYVARSGSSSSITALDVSWIALDGSGNSLYSGRKTDITPSLVWRPTGSLGSCAAASNGNYLVCPQPFSLLNSLRDQTGSIPSSLGTIKGYRIRFTAPNVPTNSTADIYTLNKLKVVSSCSAGPTNCINNFPSRLTITSTSTANGSQAQKTASVLWQPTASSIFNYVLFTEGDIIPQ